MEDKTYLILRKLFFWLFLLVFILLTPIIVFYSAGYKFNADLKKFQRTGAISLKTFPREVKVYLDGRRISDYTPYVLRGLRPRNYILTIEKEDFYPYQIAVEVKSSFVSDLDVTLIPQMRDIEELKSGLNVYNFFVLEYLFGKKIVIFADKGLYQLEEDFETLKKIASMDLDAAVAGKIAGLKEGRNKLFFWSPDAVWVVKISRVSEKKEEDSVRLIYEKQHLIKEVFFGFKEKYLIIQDGRKIIALDTEHYNITYPIFELKRPEAKIFYDSSSDILYIKDKISSPNTYSFYRINLMGLFHEKTAD